MPDAFCTSDQWSVLTAASTNSQLAGVLGGFLITAIALLFDRSTKEAVHTLALFASAILILVLSSFLFSIITGTQVSDNAAARGICAIAWTQGAVSTAMLAAGTTALFGGLGAMLATHAINKATEADPKDLRVFCFLSDFGGWLTFAAAMATTLILSETSIDYLRFMFGQRPRLWVVALIVVGSAVVTAVNFVLVFRGTRALRRSITNPDDREGAGLALRAVQIATICTGVLAVVASWLGISLARFPKEWLTDPSVAFVAVVLFLLLVLPTTIAIAICCSVASTDARQTLSSE
jgi:hypothetical protein